MIPVGGITLLSTSDWPGKVCAVLYVRGCPWRCPYCHNPEFHRLAGPRYSWADVIEKLEERRDILDGVVLSGGEPTLHPYLADALEQLQCLDYKTALHTGGAYPDNLLSVIRKDLVDWVGFDLKAPFEEYELITQVPGSGKPARISLEILLDSDVECEFRTTVYPRTLNRERLCRLGEEVRAMGVERLVLQRCHDPSNGQRTSESDLLTSAIHLKPVIGGVEVRG